MIILSTFLFACVNPTSSEITGHSSTAEDAPRLFTDYSASAQDAFKKCGVSETEYYRLLSLPYKEFDQDFTGGWRAVAKNKDCRDSAANLLKSYTANFEYEFKSNHTTLEWHTGQVLAGSGNYEEALIFFKRSYKSDEDQKDWNLYVDGTIAFLKKDKLALQAARDKLAAIPVPEKLKAARRKFLKDNPNITMRDGFVDDPGNLYILDDFIECFNESYSVAYNKCEA